MSQILAILRDPDLEARYAEDVDDARGVIRSLAGRLGQTILVDHGPLEPWEMLRTRPNGIEDIVSLDLEETGDVDSYFVVGERPYQATASSRDDGVRDCPVAMRSSS